MKIIFYENRYGDIGDKIIRFKTATWKQRFNGSWKDLPSHVELLFSDNMMFSASQYENITRFKHHNINSPKWKRIDLHTSIETEKKLRKWCQKQVGKKYDWLGVLGFVLPFIKDNPNKWFCSEICFEALKVNTDIVTKYLKIDSSKVSPALLQEITYKVIN